MGRASHYSEHRDGVVQAIEALTRKEGRAPSNRQLANEVGVGLATLHTYLKRLRDEGVIDWVERTHRSIRVRPQAHEPRPAPSPSPALAQSSSSVAPASSSNGSAPAPIKINVDSTVDVGF